MKKIIYTLLIINITILIIFHNPNNAGTEIIVADDIIDLGEVKSGSLITAKFVIINVGDKDLRIDYIQTDCHCTVANAVKMSAKKNESIIIQVRYKNNIYGFFQQLIMVYGNFHNSPIRLVVKGVML